MDAEFKEMVQISRSSSSPWQSILGMSAAASLLSIITSASFSKALRNMLKTATDDTKLLPMAKQCLTVFFCCVYHFIWNNQATKCAPQIEEDTS